ncbi:hypothetical protein KGY71_04900 [Candidatus Bipolaricaulota bacterium]|nr:hypothetical protein [Candidatus Bipolaricaulota bacterium]
MNEPNSGTNGFYEDALEKSPFGFAYHEIITDDQGEPMDYKFLEVNRAFEKLTALKESEITGERATEVFPNLTESEFGWVKQYREVALAGGEFEQVVSRLKEELEK